MKVWYYIIRCSREVACSNLRISKYETFAQHTDFHQYSIAWEPKAKQLDMNEHFIKTKVTSAVFYSSKTISEPNIIKCYTTQATETKNLKVIVFQSRYECSHSWWQAVLLPAILLHLCSSCRINTCNSPETKSHELSLTTRHKNNFYSWKTKIYSFYTCTTILTRADVLKKSGLIYDPLRSEG